MRLGLNWARADEVPTLPGLLAEHLGPDAASLPVVGETWPTYEHVNLQAGLDAWLIGEGRSHRLVGITGFQHRMFSLADLSQPETAANGPGVGSVAMARMAVGPSGATRPCVRCGLYLVTQDGVHLAILLRRSEQHGPEPGVVLEVVCADSELADAVLADVRRLALINNVFRGQVVSFGSEMFGPRETALTFHERPHLSREALVLPPGILEEIEAQVVGVARHALELQAAGLHLKRGLLLHGPPGTGKTHTVRYLLSQLDGHTVVILSGSAMNLVAPACSVARALQPALVVVEDVDLIAEARGMHPGVHPLLFQLLNEMDGLGEDVDVTFLLTTNRADLLEPALAGRPGRVDLAVEIPLPDAASRRRLVELYQGHLSLAPEALDEAVAGTEGVTASFIKELLRRAALIAATADPESGPITVRQPDLHEALDRLLGERNRLTRVLLGGEAPGGSPPSSASWMSAGPPYPGKVPPG
ncbi:MAG: ATP-binding protein [Candidatus Dormiibacterota bacterium]